jgi:hypothetical protein
MVVALLYIVAIYVVALIVAMNMACKCLQSCKSLRKTIQKSTVAKWNYRVNGWMIGLVVDATELPKDGEETETIFQVGKGKKSKDTTFYIHGRKVGTPDINALGTTVMLLILLMCITAYSVFLLEVTHTCSDDIGISCYLRFSDENDPDNPNITEEEMRFPITDCSLWQNPSIEEFISFQCFTYAFNIQGALATAGGLIVIFTIGARVTIYLIFACFKRCGNFMTYLQVILAILLVVLNTLIAVAVAIYQVVTIGREDIDRSRPLALRTAAYIADSGSTVLILTGTITLLLLVGWNKYARKARQSEEDGILEHHKATEI